MSLRSLQTQILLDAVDFKQALDDGLGMGAMPAGDQGSPALPIQESGSQFYDFSGTFMVLPWSWNTSGTDLGQYWR